MTTIRIEPEADAELGAACVRAWNDWMYEEWAEPHPDRFIPLGIAFLADPQEAAAEIRRNVHELLVGRLPPDSEADVPVAAAAAVSVER